MEDDKKDITERFLKTYISEPLYAVSVRSCARCVGHIAGWPCGGKCSCGWFVIVESVGIDG